MWLAFQAYSPEAKARRGLAQRCDDTIYHGAGAAVAGNIAYSVNPFAVAVAPTPPHSQA